MNDRFKFPKIWHLPWSEGVDPESDKVMLSEQVDGVFSGQNIVVTEKMDGENCSMYQDYIHARSLDGRDHPSRTWVKALHAQIKRDIPTGWRICGENLAATHSIHYPWLPSPFLVFAMYDEANNCLDWEETSVYSDWLGLKTVPVLAQGVYSEDLVKSCYSGVSKFACGAPQEGYVVRLSQMIGWADHGRSFAKFVRKGHVQTDEHWMDKDPVWNGFVRKA